MRSPGFRLSFGFLLILCLCQTASASTWFELSSKFSSDDNVYSYVVPYYDNYFSVDFKANLKDKLRRSTHYALNYNYSTSLYSELVEKNNVMHKIGLNLEEDIGETLVASLNSNITIFSYSDTINARSSVNLETNEPVGNDLYNYINMNIAAALRFYIFALDFTSIDWGLEYSMYNLPNYNFVEDGFAPSVNFLEEIAEYNGIGTYLTIKQSLPYTIDLEVTGKIVNQYCPERPLYETPRYWDSNTNSWVGTFSSDKRDDLSSSLTLKLSRRFAKGNYVSIGYCSDALQSNANTTIWDPAAGSYVLADEYYRRSQMCLSADGMYVFGPESSYVWVYAAYKTVDYPSRVAQEQDGTFLPEMRSDKQYSFTIEFNQRLGYLWKTNWLLKLGYQYTQNFSNDYYYDYKREILILGLSSFLYL